MLLVKQEILAPEIVEMEKPNSTMSYSVALAEKQNAQWKQLKHYTIEQALQMWYSNLSPLTKINYESGMKMLMTHGIIHPHMDLQMFAKCNHNSTVDSIKRLPGMSECSKQARAACFISFTRFLSRETEGMIPRVIPCKDEGNKTFRKVRDVVDTGAMTQAQWLGFFQALESINARDCLIGKIILQGGKRVQEVLSLMIDAIDWDNRQITFKQSKTKGVDRETVITFPESIMRALEEYIGDRAGLVFVTRTGKEIPRLQLAITFEKAGAIAKIPFKVTPHVLRASTVTYLKQQGFSDSDIMKVTGHASSEMVNAYDKSSRAENASKKVALIQ